MQSCGLLRLAQLTRFAAKHTRSLSTAVASEVIHSPQGAKSCGTLCNVYTCLLHECDLLRFVVVDAGAKAAVRRMCPGKITGKRCSHLQKGLSNIT